MAKTTRSRNERLLYLEAPRNLMSRGFTMLLDSQDTSLHYHLNFEIEKKALQDAFNLLVVMILPNAHASHSNAIALHSQPPSTPMQS